jgi:hypothetical protein
MRIREASVDYLMHKKGDREIAEITAVDTPIRTAQDFLDLIANIPSRDLIVRKEMLDEAFFDLKTGIAGDILQKVSNYQIRLAIAGDFSMYASKSLRDFMYESNRTHQVLFVATTGTAVDRLAQ